MLLSCGETFSSFRRPFETLCVISSQGSLHIKHSNATMCERSSESRSDVSYMAEPGLVPVGKSESVAVQGRWVADISALNSCR